MKYIKLFENIDFEKNLFNNSKSIGFHKLNIKEKIISDYIIKKLEDNNIEYSVKYNGNNKIISTLFGDFFIETFPHDRDRLLILMFKIKIALSATLKNLYSIDEAIKLIIISQNNINDFSKKLLDEFDGLYYAYNSKEKQEIIIISENIALFLKEEKSKHDPNTGSYIEDDILYVTTYKEQGLQSVINFIKKESYKYNNGLFENNDFENNFLNKANNINIYKHNIKEEMISDYIEKKLEDNNIEYSVYTKSSIKTIHTFFGIFIIHIFYRNYISSLQYKTINPITLKNLNDIDECISFIVRCKNNISDYASTIINKFNAKYYIFNKELSTENIILSDYNITIHIKGDSFKKRKQDNYITINGVLNIFVYKNNPIEHSIKQIERGIKKLNYKIEESNHNDKITLYHGTCLNNAIELTENGWEPNISYVGGNLGQKKYLYLTTDKEDAIWFANEKGCDTLVEVSDIPLEYLEFDPEDGDADIYDYKIDKAIDMYKKTSIPVKLVLKNELSSKHFKIL